MMTAERFRSTNDAGARFVDNDNVRVALK